MSSHADTFILNHTLFEVSFYKSKKVSNQLYLTDNFDIIYLIFNFK
jgi:hypothetical protein